MKIKRKYGSMYQNCDWLYELSYKWVAGFVGSKSKAMELSETEAIRLKEELDTMFKSRGWDGFKFEIVK